MVRSSSDHLPSCRASMLALTRHAMGSAARRGGQDRTGQDRTGQQGQELFRVTPLHTDCGRGGGFVDCLCVAFACLQEYQRGYSVCLVRINALLLASLLQVIHGLQRKGSS